MLNQRSAKIGLKRLILVCQRSAFGRKTSQKQTILSIGQGLLSGNSVLAALTIYSQVTLQPHEVTDFPLHQEPLPSVNLILKECLSCLALNQETPQSLSYQQQLHQLQFIIRF